MINFVTFSRKIILSLFILLGIYFLSVNHLQAYNLVFDDDLLSDFWNINQHYTDVIFNQSLNEFWWVFFRLDSERLDSQENLEIENETDSLDCDERVRGLYINTQRWSNLRPLDQESLDILIAQDSSYSNITLEWGRYSDCDGEDNDNIYWQINHIRSWVTYKMVAWMLISNNTYIYE